VRGYNRLGWSLSRAWAAEQAASGHGLMEDDGICSLDRNGEAKYIVKKLSPTIYLFLLFIATVVFGEKIYTFLEAELNL